MSLPSCMNFPQDHPLHAGFDAAPYLDDADCVVAVESDVLWYPALKAPRPDTKIVQIAVDPLYARYPIRGFPADAALSGTVSLNLAALADAVRGRVDSRAVAERAQRWHAEHRRLREAWAATARKAQSENPLEMVWVSKCIGDLVDENTIMRSQNSSVATAMRGAGATDAYRVSHNRSVSSTRSARKRGLPSANISMPPRAFVSRASRS